MTSEPSGKLYTAVTKYWPRIAVGLVALVGVAGWVIEGLTADTGIEFYLMAWGATTGGLWFMFEKAEKSLSEESRDKVAAWMEDSDVAGSVSSIPTQFVFLFDRVFGEKHLSRQCLTRSCAASLGAFAAVLLMKWPIGSGAMIEEPLDVLGLLFFAALLNFLPDYISLLETRWVIGRLHEGKKGGVITYLFGDFAATLAISFAALVLINTSLGFVGPPLENYEGIDPVTAEAIREGTVNLRDVERGDLREGWEAQVAEVALLGRAITNPAEHSLWEGAPAFAHLFQVGFLSAFFTSAWLWLYAASVPLSRVLLRMNNGVGFLLRVADVEKQPFRSMGFVSVIIVSALFALGLPLVLL